MTNNKLIIGLEDLSEFGDIVYTFIHAAVWVISWVITSLPIIDGGNDGVAVSSMVLVFSMFKDFAPIFKKMRVKWSRIYVFAVLVVLFAVFSLSLIVLLYKIDCLIHINILFIILFLSMFVILIMRVILNVDSCTDNKTINDNISIQQTRDNIIKAGKEKTFSEEN